MLLNQQKLKIFQITPQGNYRTNKEKAVISQLSKINPCRLKIDLQGTSTLLSRGSHSTALTHFDGILMLSIFLLLLAKKLRKV